MYLHKYIGGVMMQKKIIVLGIDGFEPCSAKKFMDEGLMPNLKEFVKKGSAREDLHMLGGVPTVTPPMWTTMATGATPATHGVTCFFNPDLKHPDRLVYALNSKLSKAEPLWNVTASAGLKTLVWHWPGSSWPPTSDSENLHVVDGTQPATVNGGASIDSLKIVIADSNYERDEVVVNATKISAGAGCIIDDVDNLVSNDTDGFRAEIAKARKAGKGLKKIITCEDECEIAQLGQLPGDTIKARIKEPTGWINTPEHAKEFTLILSKGLLRRPCLILSNADGVYEYVAIYKSKKDEKPYCTISVNKAAFNVDDDAVLESGEKKPCTRHYHLIELAPDATHLKMVINNACDATKSDYFHPRRLHEEVINNVGNIPPRPGMNGVNEQLVKNVLIPDWDYYTQWQADCLNYFMENNKYDIIFSHLHNVDAMGHQFWHFAKYQDKWKNNELTYQNFICDVYKQTDRYIGRFLKFIDEGWTILLVSDHGLVTTEHHVILGEPGGVNVPIMKELGYTTLLKDENGIETHDIDWAHTKAIASRGNHIYLNLKERYDHGIVTKEEQYDLEAQIISDLYNYRDPKTGKRIVAIALRNKDALLLGMSGPECGDIVYFMEEGFNKIHADSLSTQNGYAGTSVSPIFAAAGPGIKKGYITNRVIKQIDIAPTIATLAGVRMPQQCEGGPIYQILE